MPFFTYIPTSLGAAVKTECRIPTFTTKVCFMHRLIVVVLLSVASGSVFGQPTWKQAPEGQPVLERGAPTAETVPTKAQISDTVFSAGPAPKWIWGENNDTSYVLKKSFTLKDVTAAKLMASCDNVATIFINGKQVATSSEWQEPMSADVAAALKSGDNEITAQVSNQGGAAAFVLKLAVQPAAGDVSYVVSDETWVATAKDSANEVAVSNRGNYGDGPWNRVFDNEGGAGGVPNGTFEVPPGFVVDRLFTVPKDELGSWVCIAFDNKGRLLTSDQGDKGICRITLPPVEGGGETVVERLDFSKCEFKPSGAQGMLWAFDSLYFCCNGGPGSGLYRARDTDGDDQFDECVKLKEFRGGGEHGPHSIRLSPDGRRIFVIAGNHTQPPFNAGEEVENKNYSSRIPTNWGEDLLLPRMWDANGHARGVLAPGGWIASTDPDGQTWDIWSIGYRNPYDMAFNADGELFAYDADMEWDVGTPWYRPTRVMHATSGSEFGWRSGTGKWPEYYVDSLPAMVDIGPGSPVGADFGYGPPLKADSPIAKNARATVPASAFGSEGEFVFAPLKFPAKYQKAFYICDWTFGTMYAIHTEPHQSSYKAVKEEFVARNALPLTDCAAGPDGALYFTVGGRGTQSELYRVTYAGGENTSPTELVDLNFRGHRTLRRTFEQFQARTYTFDELRNAFKQQGITMNSLPDFIRKDRYLRYAARSVIAGDKDWIESFQRRLRDSASDPTYLVDLTVVAARQTSTTNADSALRGACLKSWEQHAFGGLSNDMKLDTLRALSLAFIRLGEPSDEEKASCRRGMEDAFPSEDWRVNRELCQMLVYLDSPTVVAKTIDLMNAPPQREDIDMGGLLTRNRGYGSAIKAMIDNQPDKQQMWYAFCLRVAKVGWTPELRADYYRWFGRAQQWSGGNSFKKFLQNIEQEAWDITPFDDRILVERAGARTPYKAPELPKPAGPGKEWTIEEVRALAADGLKGRSFEHGQKMFAATRCVLCHRFAGDGGATGPDLTQLAGRFSIESLTEAIMDPGKVISDQYKASMVVTTAGKSINGRIVSENDHQISVLTDPEDSSKVVDLPRKDIEEIQDSKVSIMPAKLLNALNQDEVLDLLAYLLSRGNEKDAMFKK
ncbi:MAG: c-type cytochrome [Planctomycetaceae bacterium]